jgi:hypothetical protein
MRTALYAPSFLDGIDPSGAQRIDRTHRYLKYYRALKDELGFDRIFLADDGSTPHLTGALGGTIFEEDLSIGQLGHPDLFILTRRQHLGIPRNTDWDYPCYWKNLYETRKVFEIFGYDKVITIDTDGFVLSRRLAEYIRELRSGWTAFHERKWNFPTAELHVLCRGNGFERFDRFTYPHFMTHNGLLMEKTIPFTYVEPQFNCGRYGEDRHPQTAEMDFYSQAPADIELHYGGPK